MVVDKVGVGGIELFTRPLGFLTPMGNDRFSNNEKAPGVFNRFGVRDVVKFIHLM